MYPVSGFGGGIGVWQQPAPSASRTASRDWKTSLDVAQSAIKAPTITESTVTEPIEAKPEISLAEPTQQVTPLAIQHYIQDIQTVASKAGYLGVSQSDIERAYRRGESLLVDYSV
jgi:hypothetical protein